MISAVSGESADDTRNRHVADEAIATVEQQFSVMFTRVKTLMRGRAARIHPDLQPLAFTILTTLVQSGPTHASELAEVLTLDKSIISRQVTLLEELGFLDRKPDAEDRRATYLAASAAAVERITALRHAEQAKLYESLRDWEVKDLDKLGELLTKLNEVAH